MNKRFREEMLKPMPLEKQQESFRMASKMILDKLSPTAGIMFSFGIMLGAFEAVCKMVEEKQSEEVEVPVTIQKNTRGSRKPRGPKRLWTKEEDAEIIKNFRMIKPKEIGEILGRTASAVSQRAFVLGLRKIKKNV
jgi:hypothetical protein